MQCFSFHKMERYMQAYLFVHFKEKDTVDGEQVYFSISRDGYHWEEVNNGKPVLWCHDGEKGARDFTIIRHKKNGKFYMLATDLCLVRNLKEKYHDSWAEVAAYGSKCLDVWESDNLTDWSAQRLVPVCNDDYGCVWAPDIIYDKIQENYIVHWSSTHKRSGYKNKGIYYSRTVDFISFTEPEPLYCIENKDYIDSAIYEENGIYYMILKSENRSESVRMLRSKNITGPYENVREFEESADRLEPGVFEGPTAVQLPDGSWNLFLDYYGGKEEIKGYIPFRMKALSEGHFERREDLFSFPGRFKHGTILTISSEEYDRLKYHRWTCDDMERS